MPERFDAIVVGAGLAGLAAAYTMARQGMTVAVMERGDYPGSKQAMGGILDRRATAEVFPEFWQHAPLERPIVAQHLWVLGGESIAVGTQSPACWTQPPYHAFGMLPGHFNAWLAQQVAEAGGLIVHHAPVLHLLRDGRGQVIGVRVNRPEGELLSDLVILADGANALLGERMELHPRRRTDEMLMTVYEVLAPPGSLAGRTRWIEQRFGLRPAQGMAIEMFGSLTPALRGNALLYTNTETIAFSVSARISDLLANQLNPHALLQAVKTHPRIAPLLAECAPCAYSAHLQPAGGRTKMLPPLYGAGVLLAGDAAGLGRGLHRDGAQLALLTGKLAGQTALAAHTKGDFSRATLAAYEAKVRQSGVPKDLRQYSRLTDYLEKHHQLFSHYPETLNALAAEYFAEEEAPKRGKLGKVWKLAGGQLRPAIELWKIV